MELRALNKDFVVVGPTRIKYSDLMWHRKYYEPGTFSIQISVEQYDDSMYYIDTPERDELGVVQKVQYTEDKKAIVLSGFFFEKKLSDKIVFPVLNMTGTRTEIAVTAVREYKEDIPRLHVMDATAAGEEVIQKEEVGTELGEMVYRTLKVEEKSFRCRYDFENDVIDFEVYKGKDRTQAQTENNFVTFSKGFRNLKSIIATKDNSLYKNYFVVAGDTVDDEQIVVILDLSGGGYKQKLYIDDTNKKYNANSQSIEEYREILMQDAIEKAEKYVSISNVEFDTIADSGFKYLEDYNLGDKCDVIVDAIQMSFEARIIEVIESETKGKRQETLIFGDKIPTQYEKARIK